MRYVEFGSDVLHYVEWLYAFQRKRYEGYFSKSKKRLHRFYIVDLAIAIRPMQRFHRAFDIEKSSKENDSKRGFESRMDPKIQQDIFE